MNACQAVQELLTAHLLEALGPSETALVRDHLGACAVCREARDETQSALEHVEAPPVAPSPEVWKRLRQRIAQRESEDPVRDHAPDLVISLSCSFCRGGLTRAGAVYCAACLAPHHPECFIDHGRCSVMGCGETRVVRPSELGGDSDPAATLPPGGGAAAPGAAWVA